jgi:hypothetical protein
VKQPLRIGGGLGPANRFQGRIAGVRVYRSAVTPEEITVLALPERVNARMAAQKIGVEAT